MSSSRLLTWTQLGLHRKPCGLLNVDGYFDSLLAFFDRSVEDGFLQAEHRAMVLIDRNSDRLLDKLAAFELPDVDKTEWVRGLEDP